jgi:hypothetical protein
MRGNLCKCRRAKETVNESESVMRLWACESFEFEAIVRQRFACVCECVCEWCVFRAKYVYTPGSRVFVVLFGFDRSANRER